MKVQQAPSPVQSALLLPATVALLIAQSKKGGTTRQSRTSTSRVSTVFVTELTRLRRSPSITQAEPLRGPSTRPPGAPPGNAADSARASSTVMTGAPASAASAGSGRLRGARRVVLARSPLHQGDTPVVPVHEGREEQIDGQE